MSRNATWRISIAPLLVAPSKEIASNMGISITRLVEISLLEFIFKRPDKMSKETLFKYESFLKKTR